MGHHNNINKAFYIFFNKEDTSIIANKETKSVIAVQGILSNSEYLDASGITQADRTPSWDGEIIVYNSANHKVSNVEGRVSVQVKGTEMQSLEDGIITYSVRIADLNNYLHDGGALFFVVGLHQEGGSRVYFRRLAPFDINEIIKETTETQETIALEFMPFPTDKDEISTEIFSFLHDCRKQSLIRKGGNILDEDVAKEIGKDKFTYEISFTGIGYENRNPLEYFLEHDSYLYLENKKLNISFPVKLLKKADMIETIHPVRIQIGDTVYFKEVKKQLKRNQTVIRLGTCVEFVIHDDGKLVLSFHRAGNIEERLVGELFLRDFITHDRWIIDGKEQVLPFDKDELDNTFSINELEKEIHDLIEIKETLNYYGVTDVLEIDGVSNQDLTHLTVLTNARKNGKVILKKSIEPGLQRLKVNNLQIVVFINEVGECEYTIKSFFSETLPCKIEIDGKYIATSQYVGLGVLDFSVASNINYKKIIKDITLYNTDDHIDQMRRVLLRMLRAYDDTSNKLILDNASKMAKKLNKVKPTRIDLLNVLQCNKRLRTLKKGEIRELKRITEEESDPELLTAAFLLLDEQDDAKDCYQSILKNRKEAFDSYPINLFRTF